MLIKNPSDIHVGWNYQWGCCSRPLSSRVLRCLFVGGILTCFVFFSTWYSPDTAYVNWRGLWNSSIVERYNGLTIFLHKVINRPKPIILLWTPYFSDINWLPPLKDLDCPMDCQITLDRQLLNRSAAVIFHLRNVDLEDLPPWDGNSTLKWVLFNKESPHHTPVNIMQALEGKIHWIATYRRDSTFHAPYGTVVKRKSLPKQGKNRNFDSHYPISKRYLVCWIVSHCSTPSQREAYAKALAHYVPIAIYGSCGTELCSNGNAKDCYQHISPSCKFYLSFENSICREYVTEKLFYALNTEMVPIVMGGANYSQILPEHSYIDALNFLNPKDLADYLLKLNDNVTEYQAYHRWKTEYEVVDVSFKWACGLCHRLYEDAFTDVDMHQNMSSWWIDSANCTSWRELFSKSNH